MIREDIRNLLENTFPGEEIVVDYVPEGKEGDYYTNLAFKIAARERKDPQEVARRLAARITGPIIDKVTVLPPAFINFTLRRDYLCDRLRTETNLDIGHGQRILIEYVSANPTGPINVVSARAAAVGDSLIRLLRKTGFAAEAEYYVNDTGRQADLLAESVRQRLIEIRGGQARIPEDGYHGEYVKELAGEIAAQGVEDTGAIRDYSIEHFIRNHETVMREFGVVFDVWTRESEIYRGNYVSRAHERLRDQGKTYVEDGAEFFRTTEYGDDKDRVIVTKDGRNTYLLPDIAYHLQKMERKYDLLVDIWGPDHQGHIKGILGGLQALGYPPQALRVLIVQEVKIKEHGRVMSMSKRAGKFAALADLLARVPRDVIRFFFLMRSSSQPLDFDLDLALKQSDENPVYYVQYAHARIQSIIAYAAETGLTLPPEADLALLAQPEEINLVKQILRFEEILSDAVRILEPYQITYYLLDLARAFHFFYQKHRVVGEDDRLAAARLYLITKTAATIRAGLDLLGVSCPERM